MVYFSGLRYPLICAYVCVGDRIYVHSAIANWRRCIHTIRLPDAVVDIVWVFSCTVVVLCHVPGRPKTCLWRSTNTFYPLLLCLMQSCKQLCSYPPVALYNGAEQHTIQFCILNWFCFYVTSELFNYRLRILEFLQIRCKSGRLIAESISCLLYPRLCGCQCRHIRGRVLIALANGTVAVCSRTPGRHSLTAYKCWFVIELCCEAGRAFSC